MLRKYKMKEGGGQNGQVPFVFEFVLIVYSFSNHVKKRHIDVLIVMYSTIIYK